MNTEHLFAREEVLPSWWANALGFFLSVSAFQFELSKLDDTHLQVLAGAGDQAAAVPVKGRWRWVEAPVSRAHPGGAAGTYDVFVTAAENNVVSAPAPYTDDTNYAFALAIVPVGATPAIVAGTVDIFRKVGQVLWDGAKITKIEQAVPSVGPHAWTHATAGSDPIAPADIGAATEADLLAEVARAEAAEATLVPTGSDATLASLTLNGPGVALTVNSNASIGGTLGVTGAASFASVINANAAGTGLAVAHNASIGGTLGVTGTTTLGVATVTGLLTAQAGAAIDAGSGTAAAVLTLTGRNAGVASSATVTASTAGGLTYAVVNGQAHTFTMGAATATLSSAAFNLPGGAQYQIGGAQIAAANLSNGVTGAGAVVLAGSPAITGVLTVAAISASGGYTQSGSSANSFTGNTTFAGTLGVTGDSTLSGAATVTGLVTGRGGLTLDAGSGTASQTVTLTGRNAGAAASASIAVSSTGGVTYNVPAGQSQVFQVAAGTIATVASTGVTVTTDITARAGAASAVAVGAVGPAGASGITFQGGEAGSNLYRSAAGVLTTDGSLNVTGQYRVGGAQIAAANLSDGTTGTGGAVVLAASAVLTGTPAAPTAAVGTNTTQLATTAFVLAQAASATPLAAGTAAVGTSTRYARGDHVHPTDTSRASLTTNTFSGLQTLQAGLALDAGSGTASQTITLTGRSGGTAASATIKVETTAQMTFNVPSPKTYVFNVAGTTALQVGASGVTVSAGLTLDAGSGSAGQTITLVDRSGLPVTSTIAATGGYLTISSPNGIQFSGALSFFGVAPTGQLSAVGAVGRTGGSLTGSTFHPDDTYTGGVGSTGYTIGDIVRALKLFGLIAS